MTAFQNISNISAIALVLGVFFLFVAFFKSFFHKKNNDQGNLSRGKKTADDPIVNLSDPFSESPPLNSENNSDAKSSQEDEPLDLAPEEQTAIETMSVFRQFKLDDTMRAGKDVPAQADVYKWE